LEAPWLSSSFEPLVDVDMAAFESIWDDLLKLSDADLS
jgi:hypothetical protein